jgi:uncharacterized protein YgbK (DUF1537 family)
MTQETWPDGLLVAYYADDFTGSTDAMEAMTTAGVPTVLFLDTPTPQMLASFPQARCVGIAGSSRGRDPAWMDAHLPQVFTALAQLGAPILHYKICSTFDSSAATGSIGRAIDLGTTAMPGDWSPMVVGAPRLKRYQLFGNLFAAVDGVGYRLDRHPTMSRHPVTPMGEADLRRHLAAQTARRIELIDMTQLRDDAAGHVDALAGEDVPVILIDVLDDATLAAAGRLIWEQRGPGLFSASSSGLGYALTAHWRACGLLPEQASLPVSAPTASILVVSGSCSPVTAAQIAWARAHGFAAERLQLAAALDPLKAEVEIARVADMAVTALQRGVSPLIFSAEGPDNDPMARFVQIARDAGLSRLDAARSVGQALSVVTRRVLDRVRPGRVVIAGGDSSGEIVNALDIQALTIASSFSPGAPVCRAWSQNPKRDGLEIVLKGGQIGNADFFGLALSGPANA